MPNPIEAARVVSEVAGAAAEAIPAAAALGARLVEEVAPGLLKEAVPEVLKEAVPAAKDAWEIIAHRFRLMGELDGVPGNTLKAVDDLLGKYPNISVETDVRLTKGGGLRVWHDNLLDDCTNGQGFLSELPPSGFDDLRVQLGGKLTDYQIPTLQQVLDRLGGRGKLYLELKYGLGDPPGLLDQVLGVMKEHPKQNFVLSSFNHPVLKDVPNSIQIGVLTNAMPSPSFSAYTTEQFMTNGRTWDKIAFHPDIRNLTDEALANVPKGVPVNAYTVPPGLFERTYRLHINPITDFPQKAMEFLAGIAQ